jgi:Fe-S cluster assembly protein SufD
MTVAATRTKAEQALAQSFEAIASRLPGGRAVAEARKTAIGTFSALGLPHRRIEQWKYTDLRASLKEAFTSSVAHAGETDARALEAALGPLADLDAVRLVFVDGVFAEALSRLDAGHGRSYHFDPLARGLEKGFGWLAARIGDTGGPKGTAVVALNTAFMTDGALLRVVKDGRPAKPFHLVFAATGSARTAATTRSFVEIGEGAEAVLIESHVVIGGGAKQANAMTEIEVLDRGRVRHLKVTVGGAAGSAHLATWLCSLGAGSRYNAFQLTAGAPLVRNQLWATFKGEGAKLDISGCFLGTGSDHIDTTLVIDHAVPGCESRELFKGVLAGKARGVFQGKVIVRPDAQKTDGKQMAQALLLSPEAEFDSKPELEIFADDVVCGHGSTSAEIDEDLLFYMLSRGIPRSEARALLIESFIGEAIDKVEDERLRVALFEIAKSRLAALSAARPDQGGGTT